MTEDTNKILALIVAILVGTVLLFSSAFVYAVLAWGLLALLSPLSGIVVSFRHTFVIALVFVLISIGATLLATKKM